jgi:hypothetical protein
MSANRPVQFGPTYYCWVCGAPAVGIIDFSTAMGGPTALDKYASYIGYLDLPVECRRNRHPARVARLGAAITPLHFPERCSVEEKTQAIRDAVEYLASLGIHEETLAHRIARIVHLVRVGAIEPDRAVNELCDLAGIQPVSVPVFSEVDHVPVPVLW